MKEDKVKKVFLDELPRYIEGRFRGKINWEKCKQYSVFFIHEDIEGYIKIIDYIKKKQILLVSYKNKEYKIATSCFIACKLGNILGMKTSEFKVEIGTRLHDDKRDLIITDRTKIVDKGGIERKYYKYKCFICGFNAGEHYKDGEYKEELWIEESHLIRNRGCSCCNNKIVVEGINDIPTTAPWMVKYFQGGYDEAKLYTKRSNKKIHPICPDCGRVNDKLIVISDIYESGIIKCYCSDNNSYPNKFAFKMFEELNIDFKTEFNPEWCKYLFKNNLRQGIYDLYFKLYDKEYIIEMDGEFHSKDNKMNGITEDESKFFDREKDRLAEEHNIKVVRIDCNYNSVETRFEHIKKNILENEILNELFDLSKVDFNKCNEFALSNLVKVACEYKKNKPDITCSQIGKLMKKALCTIISWLKIGNELGWCHYDSQEESIKSVNFTNFNRKQVEIFKDGISKGVFESATELERQSEVLFGVKLTQTMISKVCLGKTKQYKGFIFIYK